MKKFEETFIKRIDHTELDLDFPFYDNLEDEEGNNVIIPHKKLTYVDYVPSIDIDVVIKTLNDLKEAGSNRIYIATHEDHHGYYFYGVQLNEIK